MSPAPIVVLGSVNMDLVGTVTEFPRPGETVLGDTFRTVPGGKGGNQAIAAARAGRPVAFLGSVGRDDFGTALAEHLRQEGVDVELLRRSATASGIALITVSGSGENTIVVVPGANGERQDIDDDEAALIRGAAILVCQLEIPLDRVVAGARIAQQAGVPVLVNASPVTALPTELVRAATLVVVNEGEAAELGPTVADVPHLVVTLGAAGARYRRPDGQEVAIPTVEVTPVDTTGAGDAFAGALAAAWSRGDEPAAAVRYACIAGALATTVAGAGTSAPTHAEISSFVDS